MNELTKIAENIYNKIMNLQNRTSNYKEQRSLVNFRISFMHKINAILYHFGIIQNIKSQVEKIIEETHKNNEFIISDVNMRKSLSLAHELEFKYTTLMEDIIYHTMSAIDNLPLILAIYYKGIASGISFNSVKNALNHEHTQDYQITKKINENWEEWIEELHKFRANIYHYHSKICEGHMSMELTKNESGNIEMQERFVIKIPQELRKALKYQDDKEIEIEEFCLDIISKTFSFFNEVLDIVTENQALIKDKLS